ncbi:hypothetical protein [Glutamicibacter nicotianae]|uniref:hypothetical protein n=1 Tax=Glutamicibacter nicotianae TaxID=37929 RepID=UPI0025546E94|nr:hypothetical protein [Glutamicibacter nicotianae]WIV44539.1 hypothetical protein QQS42_02665 [Glutamicibacter nicotianae]
MQGSLDLSGRAATVKLRVAARNLPPGASVTLTDVMLQPGGAASGWIPHTTELPWAAGMTGDDVGGGGPVYWDEILGKPSQFPPTSHTHSIAQVAGLQAALDAKAAAAHTHPIGQVSGLQAALDAKAASGHTHAVGDVTGLQAKVTALDTLLSQMNEGTGRVNISANFPSATIGTGGGVFIERRGPGVFLSFAAVDFGTAYAAIANAIPTGFRPSTFVYENIAVNNGAGSKQVDVLASGTVRIQAGVTGALRGTLGWFTTESWPI